MKRLYYVLGGDGRTPVATTFEAWAMSRVNPDASLVAFSDFRDVEVAVSTCFLGWNSRRDGGSPPLLFESRVFGGPNAGDVLRGSTWAEAEAQHAQLCAPYAPTQQDGSGE